ncbi:MAG TPA: ABC transporter permease subunit [Thermoplasmata archaeon]|nr:ABC transporter permease subunit [Thermoplasmata archaeon]
MVPTPSADAPLGTPIAAPVPALAAQDVLFDRSARTTWRLGFDRWAGWLLPLLFLVAILPILDLVWYISKTAIPTLTWEILTSFNYRTVDALGVPIVSTVEVLALSTAFAVLLGVFGGIATAEFLSDRSAGWVRVSANMLAGTPSVVLGYFGFFTFCIYAGWGYVMMAGVLTLAFFMTPYIFRIADLAYTSIPRPIREAAYGSGTRPHQYIVKVATPIAFPQVLNGIFLAMAIGLGETAPIVLTTTGSKILPPNLFAPVTYMTALIWADFSSPSGSGGYDVALQCAFLLVVAVVGLNILVRVISARYRKRLEGLYQ